ncbi:hypothetical protein BTL_698 [Burkholderia thailandensis H0587]|nr:hypothetical protein BTL_698 [Burkholderia thailandensis H0587]
MPGASALIKPTTTGGSKPEAVSTHCGLAVLGPIFVGRSFENDIRGRLFYQREKSGIRRAFPNQGNEIVKLADSGPTLMTCE